MAAPLMPISKVKMNIGSRIMLSTAPTVVAAMAKRGLPSARMAEFIPWANIYAGNPRMIMS